MEDAAKKLVVHNHGIGALRDALQKLPGVMRRYNADALIVGLCAVPQGSYAFNHIGGGTIMLGFNRNIFTAEDLLAADGILAAVGLSPEMAAALALGQRRMKEAGRDEIVIEDWMLIPPEGTATA